LVVTNEQGNKAVTVQVKTKTNAFGGKKGDQENSWLFWPIAAKHRAFHEDCLVYAFVDMKEEDGDTETPGCVPDVYVVPAAEVANMEHRDPWPKNSDNPTMDFFWIPKKETERFLSWDPITKILGKAGLAAKADGV